MKDERTETQAIWQAWKHSLRRIAEAANQQGAKIYIPTNPTERSWDILCEDVIDWLDYLDQQRNRWNKSDDGD